MSVFQRSSESRQADDVGLRRRKLYRAWAVAADEQRDLLLIGQVRAQLADDGAETLHPFPRARVRTTEHRPLRGRVARADAEDHATARERVDGRGTARDEQRLANARVQHVRPE